MPDEVNPIYQKVKVGYERDGVRYHKCGRPWVECQQMNGEFWCEIVKEVHQCLSK